ncbi:arginine/serine-rich coiled-coil protein 2 isoform X2 [Anabrus simplex]|uniref:arginine/serine-rich coiled-coil protein 2 isoform X2 n=1 Tax=Anabrus simplex TaxID=316456 RepID=UPI0034DD2EC4
MESLVSYGSDDEGSQNYLDMKDSMQGRMERLERPGGDDTNYDNVQMDMSEDSNNNNSSSDSSSEDEKSSARSSSSASSASGSGGSSRRINLSSLKERSSFMNKKSPTPSLPKDPKSERDDRRLRESPRGNDQPSKIDFDKDHRRDRQDTRDFIKHSSSRDKDKERSRYLDRPNRDKSGRSERDRRSRSRDRRSGSHERQSKNLSRSKDLDIRSGGSSEKDRERCRSSKSRDRQRSHSRDRRSRSRDQRRSRSRDRRSRSRDRRSRSRDRPSKDHRRRGYDKKPNKLTVLERLGIELRAPEMPPAVTPQQLLQRSIEAQVQQVKSNTGIELPKYYNPAAMNPARYAEQMQKRKLLWGNKSTKTETATVDTSKPAAPASNNKWEGTTFAQDQDGRMTAKFKRLMGIKDPAPSGGASSSGGANGTQNPEGSDILKKQEELFNSMEMQYEVARVATHTHRGLGLGFGTFQYPR